MDVSMSDSKKPVVHDEPKVSGLVPDAGPPGLEPKAGPPGLEPKAGPPRTDPN